MSARPVNEEQFQAEMQALTEMCPAFAVQMTPRQWLLIIGAACQASRHPDIPEAGRVEMKSVAEALAKAFPADCKEIHRIIEAWKAAGTYGESL